MNKRIDPTILKTSPAKKEEESWIDLDAEAEVEVTSEDREHPIEAALFPGHKTGWRAGASGRQKIRVLFSRPRDIHLIRLVFTEEQHSRTQEFVLRWSAESGGELREILRQQYNFTPISTQVENYTVHLRGVTVLELEITPSIDNPTLVAELTELRLR